MSTISLPATRRARSRALSLPAVRPELAALLVLAGVLYLWALDRNGFANEYYSAAVRSMSTSWHAFLYGSFDTSGVMTVDKPPLALWVQALSARAFGFSSWSILVPQALMGVATVGLTYDLTRRQFGRVAGFAAGLALVLTPVTVAIARHNNPDALLVLCCTAALWFLVRGLEDGRTRWLVLAGVAVGLGFEAKMAAALLVVPAIAAAWVWAAPRNRVKGLLAGGAAMTVIGLAWPLLMWLTPAADRPWISGTSDNSIWSLILGYNGLGRLFGQDGGPGGMGGGGTMFGGEPGLLRLLNEALGGQAGWLLGVALVGGVALLALTRLKRTDARTGWLIAVGGTFLTIAVAFSRAEGIFHPYYVAQLAPFTAALAGATVAMMLNNRFVAAAARGRRRRDRDDDHRRRRRLDRGGRRLRRRAARERRLRPQGPRVHRRGRDGRPADHARELVGADARPRHERDVPGRRRRDDGRRTGGGGGPGGGNMFGGDTSSMTAALEYAAANGGGTIAVSSQSGAAGSLITSGADVAAIGGFSGRESQVTVEWLADAVEQGRIRYVLTEGADGLGNDSRIGSSQVMAAVEQVGTPTTVDGLYDLSGLADELRAL